jgi:hypothetical protein
MIMRRLGGRFFVVCLVLAGATSARAEESVTKALVDKAIKACGGEAKMAKLNLIHWKGKGTAYERDMEIPFTHEASMAGNDRLRMDLSAAVGGMQIQALLVINRDKAWAKSMDMTKEPPKDELAPVLHTLYALRMPSLLPALKDKAYTLSPLGEVKVEDRTAVGLTVARKDYPDVNLFFDKESGLPVKCELRIKERGGREVTMHILYADYKESGGAKYAAKMTFKREDKQMAAIEFTELEPKDKFEDSLFDKP